MPSIILFRAGMFNNEIHLFLRAQNTSMCGQIQITTAALPNDPEMRICRQCMRDSRRALIRKIP